MRGCGRTQKWKKMQHSQRTILVYYCCGHKEALPFLNFPNWNFSTWSWSSSFTNLWGQSAKTRLCAHNNNELRVLEFCSFFNPTTRLIDYKLCFYCLPFTPWLVLQYLCHVCHCLFNFLWALQGFSSVKFSHPAWPSSFNHLCRWPLCPGYFCPIWLPSCELTSTIKLKGLYWFNFVMSA